MRILFIAPLPDPVTGQSLACKVLLDELIKQHEVEVIDINKSSLKSGTGSCSRIHDVLGYAWSALWRARHADVIYFTISESVAGNLKDMLIYLACFGRLDRMAVHLHGGAGMRVLMHERPVLAALNRFFLKRLGAIILLGERHLDILRDLPPPRRVHLAPNFAQDYLFRDRNEIEAKFASSGPLKLLYLSNLIPGKGHHELLAAYESLAADEQEKIVLQFAGAFENESAKRAFLQRVDNLPGASYHGIVGGEKKERLLGEAHVFCLPTYYPYEGQPISILEAYASGCAVITTNHSGIFDVFDPTTCGLAVEVRSPSSIALALRQALQDMPTMRRAALHNRGLAEQRYRVATYNRRLVSVLAALALKAGIVT